MADNPGGPHCHVLELRQSGKTDVYLWCDGYLKESESQGKRKRDDSPGPTSKRAEKERYITYRTEGNAVINTTTVICNIDCGQE